MMKISEFKLIIGLGNSGVEYLSSYHNAGFLFTEFIAGKNSKKKMILSFSGGRTDFRQAARFYERIRKGAASAMKYFRIKPAEILVVHDDADLAAGNYKISFGRGAGGHRGVASVIDRLKTKDFWRLRIGIRSPSANPEQAPSEKRTAPKKRPKAGNSSSSPLPPPISRK